MQLCQFLRVGVAALAVTVAFPANAATLIFNFSGPSGTAVFELDSNPIPDFSRTVFPGSDQFGFTNVAGVFGGVPGTASTINFGTGIVADFQIVAPNLGFTQFSGSSPALFTGAIDAPVFAPGTFQLLNPFLGNGTLTITAATAAVPEPMTWAMMVLGFGLLGGALRAKRRKARVSVSYA